MKNYLKLFDEIQYRDLAPWLDINKPNEKFTSLISEIKSIKPKFRSHYEIEFYGSFNQKTKYYHKLIQNESINYCNKIFHLINEEENLKVQRYLRNEILIKKLPSRLSDISNLIKERQYTLDFINPHKSSFDIDSDHKTETYILQLLKIALIRVYLEIQMFFSFIPNEDLLTENDFYSLYLNEPIPEKSFIKNTKPIIEFKIEEPKISLTKSDEISFKSFTYKEYYIDSDKLTDLLYSLKKNNFIAQETNVANFKKIFSGNEITKPVYWTGNPSEFYYFIQLIYTINKLVSDLKQQHWKVACKCFVQADGTPFDISKLRGLKKPQLTYRKLEHAVGLLK